MTTLVDAPARHAIRTDLASTLVVEAAAGTGKTTEMIARIIAVIRSGVSTLERIVAVTFTEKAAGEMKLRLRTELEKQRRDATGDELQRLIDALAELEVARIGTIHSFCADLLRERPIEAKIDPVFEVCDTDDEEHLLDEAFDGWFQAAVANPGAGVQRILRREHPTELLRAAGASLVQRRDFDGPWQRDATFDRDAAIDFVLHELANLAVFASRADQRGDALAELFVRLDHWLAELARREAVRGRDHDGLEAELGQIASWFEWKKTGRRKMYGANLTRADVALRRDETKALLDKLVEDAQADLAALLHDELRPLVAAYEALKARRGKLDFIDLLAKARDLLRDDPDVRAEMQARFTHFFVDEFQDTDPLQVDILLLLCADSPTAAEPATVTVRPGKLFIVGDPKQAIYRFRRADIALYETVKQRLLGQGAQLLHLTTSFRSVPAIQSAVNAAFAPIMTGEHQAAYVALQPHRQDVTTQPAIVALPVPEPYGKWNISNVAIEDSYPDAVGAFVDYLVKRSGWTVSERAPDGRTHRVPIDTRHICLVFRRFQSFRRDLTRPYVRALEARSIPHVLLGGRSFHEREEIEATRNALKAIEWPDDELSVYATLRGSFFSFHDEDLIAFRHANKSLHPIRFIAAPDLAPNTPDDPATSIAAALALLARLHRGRNRRPIADTLQRLLSATRSHAAIANWPAGEQALANVFRVMDLARRFEAKGTTSFRAFVERLDSDAAHARHADAPIVEEGTEGVRIMTVHSAKGLEFPVVILCDPTAAVEARTPTRHVDAQRRVWLESIAQCVPAELRARAPEVIARDREEVERLAYVAVTRARDLLVVPVVGDEERHETWLHALIPVVYPHPSTKRAPERAPGCPPFGDDSVRRRTHNTQAVPESSVAPGQHTPRAGGHRVTWWDPRALSLDAELGGGLRQQQILAADDTSELALESERTHSEWLARRATALANGIVPTTIARKLTEVARSSLAPPVDLSAIGPVALHETSADRSRRPGGVRFGALVHATMAAIDLRAATREHVRAIATGQARLLGAPPGEVAAAIDAVLAAVAHPLVVRAGASPSLRREVPVVLATPTCLIEGIVDLAFDDGGAWLVVDFKTDSELAAARTAYENQVRLYARAISEATGRTATAALLMV